MLEDKFQLVRCHLEGNHLAIFPNKETGKFDKIEDGTLQELSCVD